GWRRPAGGHVDETVLRVNHGVVLYGEVLRGRGRAIGDEHSKAAIARSRRADEVRFAEVVIRYCPGQSSAARALEDTDRATVVMCRIHIGSSESRHCVTQIAIAC